MKCTYQGIQSEDVQNNEQNPCHNCISGSNSDNRTCGDSSKPGICRQQIKSNNQTKPILISKAMAILLLPIRATRE